MISEEKRKNIEQQLSDDTLLLLIGNTEICRNGDVFYPFRQDSDFLLLTGASIRDLKLLAYKERGNTQWILYSDPISEKEQLWGTTRISEEALKERTGIKNVRNHSEWERDVSIFAEKSHTISLREIDQRKMFRGFSRHRKKFRSLEYLMSPLRMKKTEEEIQKMRKAIGVTQVALEYVHQSLSTYQYEREIEADIAMIYRRHGMTEAYPTIVASGPNACILHSTDYERRIEHGDLILIDTGAEFDGYAADISRTFVKGETSDRKREIYEAVRMVQLEVLAQIRPGRTWDEHETVMRAIMNERLIDLNLIPKQSSNGEREYLSRKYFPHRMSHFLGLDVHDSGNRNDILMPSMTITVEPGIYIPDEGIGVRIEDDIRITEDGCELLSEAIAK